jgi:hypothetical protein
MQIDPATEWLRLTRVYGEMGDVELRELDADRGNLTEVAQQVLRDELRKRGLKPLPEHADAPQIASWQDASSASSMLVSDDPPADDAEEDSGDRPREFTWKTQLCECLDRQQAMELFEALRLAGIQSWIEAPYSAFGSLYPRVFVAADQLEQAREVADRPIPQAIADAGATGSAEYELPHCPKCGAEDPVLESADPTNQWLCEICGAQWADPADEPDGSRAPAR